MIHLPLKTGRFSRKPVRSGFGGLTKTVQLKFENLKKMRNFEIQNLYKKLDPNIRILVQTDHENINLCWLQKSSKFLGREKRKKKDV
jgi:hypothetical protein